MSAPAGFGFRPEPDQLTTVEGCSHTLRRIASIRQQVLNPPGPRTQATAALIRAESARLALMVDEVKAIRTRLGTDDRLRWERMFVWCAHEVLDAATYAAISEAAKERVEAQQRVSRGASTGSAVASRGGGTGIKVRR